MPDAPVFPCFKPADWEGSDTIACRRLSVGDVESQHLPWLAFGHDLPDTFEFLKKEDLGGVTVEDLQREAIRSVQGRGYLWEPVSVKLGFFKKMKMLCNTSDFFAAEKILDRDCLKDAAETLKTDLLAVGIPRRGMLIVTDGKQPMERLARFAAAVSAQYHRAESPPITPAVFAVADGKLVGMLQGGEDPGEDLAEEETADDDSPYIQGMVVADKATGLEEVLIFAGGSKLQPLAQGIESAFRQTLQNHTPRQEFGGKIRVVVIKPMTPAEVREPLGSLEQHLRGALADMSLKTASGHPVHVAFEYHDDPGAV